MTNLIGTKMPAPTHGFRDNRWLAKPAIAEPFRTRTTARGRWRRGWRRAATRITVEEAPRWAAARPRALDLGPRRTSGPGGKKRRDGGASAATRQAVTARTPPTPTNRRAGFLR